MLGDCVVLDVSIYEHVVYVEYLVSLAILGDTILAHGWVKMQRALMGSFGSE